MSAGANQNAEEVIEQTAGGRSVRLVAQPPKGAANQLAVSP